MTYHRSERRDQKSPVQRFFFFSVGLLLPIGTTVLRTKMFNIPDHLRLEKNELNCKMPRGLDCLSSILIDLCSLQSSCSYFGHLSQPPLHNRCRNQLHAGSHLLLHVVSLKPTTELL